MVYYSGQIINLREHMYVLESTNEFWRSETNLQYVEEAFPEFWCPTPTHGCGGGGGYSGGVSRPKGGGRELGEWGGELAGGMGGGHVLEPAHETRRGRTL